MNWIELGWHSFSLIVCCLDFPTLGLTILYDDQDDDNDDDNDGFHKLVSHFTHRLQFQWNLWTLNADNSQHLFRPTIGHPSISPRWTNQPTNQPTKYFSFHSTSATIFLIKIDSDIIQAWILSQGFVWWADITTHSQHLLAPWIAL